MIITVFIGLQKVATFQHVSVVYFNKRCLEHWAVGISQRDHNPVFVFEHSL